MPLRLILVLPAFARRTLASLLGLLFFLPSSSSALATQVPMDALHWRVHGTGAYFAKDGSLALKRGSSAVWVHKPLGSGVVTFDVKATGGISGVTFHQRGDTGDALYFRPSADCAVSDDCMQYMRMDHGIFEWDLFGGNQTRAPFRLDSWNHVKMVVQGRNMRVWLNGERLPLPTDGSLAGAYGEGAITLHGPATYANFKVHPPAAPSALIGSVAPGTADPSFLRNWEVSRAFAMPLSFDRALGQDTGLAPTLESLPKPGAGWRRTTATPAGLVNVTALLGSDQQGSHITAAWLKTRLLSDRDQIKHVSVGWTRELWVFVNGKLVFADKNLYGVAGASKTPDGRLSLQNGSFDLPLVKGSNHIVVVLDDNFGGGAQHFGWGLMMRLADTNGITLPPAMDMTEAKSTTPGDAVR